MQPQHRPAAVCLRHGVLHGPAAGGGGGGRGLGAGGQGRHGWWGIG